MSQTMEWKRAFTVGRTDGLVHFIVYVYFVSPYSPSQSPLSKSMHLVPLLLHHPLKVSGGLRGTHDRKEALEG